MPPKRTDIDTDDLIVLYETGQSAANIGKQFGISVVAQFAEGIPLDDIATFHGIKQPTLRKRLAELGIPIRESLEQRRVMLDAKSVVRRYLAGESEQSLALAYSVSRSVIRRQLIGSGITPRNRSDAMFTRMANTSQDERLRLATAAHNAVRGVKRPESELEARARS